jgi:hypothetical protein
MVFLLPLPRESNVRRILRIKSVCTACTVMTNLSLEGPQIETKITLLIIGSTDFLEGQSFEDCKES